MMMIVLMFLFGLAVADQNDLHNFTAYHQKFGKTYEVGSQEYLMRATIFKLRVNEIVAHNSNPDNSWDMGVNEFTDWTSAEFQKMLGLKSSLLVPNVDADAEVAELDGPLADSLNWCDKGACTPVKNQGGCGSCWSFAGTESIESDIFVETGKLAVLAPQEFVDCAPNPDHCGGTGGCEGSTADLLFKYAIGAGIAAEADYKYHARDGQCKINNTKITAKIKAFTVVKSNDAQALLAAINKQPIAVNVAAMSWQSYRGGIMSFNARDLTLDHVVQLVGYGTDGGKDYWVVRNSWGPSWGEKGFIRVERFTSGKAAPCGTDNNNQDGVGCKTDPKKVTVCGVSGILYATSYPTGGALV